MGAPSELRYARRRRVVRRRVVGAAALVLLLGGCSGDRAIPHPGSDATDPGSRVISAGPLWGADEGWRVTDTILRLGVIDGESPYVFSRVRGAVRLPGGGLAVLDGHSFELRGFSEAGVHLWTSGGRGHGPGEFLSPKPRGLALAEGDRLQVEDDLARVIFDADGSLFDHEVLDWARVIEAGSFSTDCRPVPKFLNEHILLGGCDTDVGRVRDTGPWKIEVAVVRTAWSLDRFDTIGVFLREDAWALSIQGAGTLYMPGVHGEVGFLATGGKPGRLAFARSHEYRIEVHDIAGRDPGPVLVVERSDPGRLRVPTRAELDEAWSRWDARAAQSQLMYGNRSDLDAIRSRITPPASIATISGLFVDDLNAIWVDHRPRTGPESDRGAWGVFTEAGAYLGEVSLPPNLTPYQIGEDFVLGVLHEEYGVEYVVVLALDRSRPVVSTDRSGEASGAR